MGMRDMDEIEETGHFKMRGGDDVEDLEVPATVDELRLEKINTRLTFISILIPVLIVIVLVIGYLDIKKMVLRSEDTGTMSVQNLSKDLESRFSSLSLRQAQLEEQATALGDQNSKAMARIEVKLKDLTDSVAALNTTTASKKVMQSSIADVDKKLNNIGNGLEETQSRFNATIEQWHKSMEQWEADLKSVRETTVSFDAKLKAVNEKLARIDQNKIDKPSMELAMRLEALKIEENLKSPLNLLQQKVRRLENQLKGLGDKPVTTPAPPSPEPAPTRKNPQVDAPATIEEQTIP
jgi:DNA repair exonuclease SbcCD ATPase subunit